MTDLSAAVVNSSPSETTMLAIDRTRLAHDRTLMAWVRTAISLISFGFTIYKFFDYAQKETEPRQGLLGPREFALIMISIGIIALALATFQHRRDMVRMRAIHPQVPKSLATVLSGLISLLGVIALLAVIFRQ